MNCFPVEIIDHIIYFTTVKIINLSLISKYFNQNSAKIRIISNYNHPSIDDKKLIMLPNITTLDLRYKDQITNIKNLFNLTALNLSNNFVISDNGIKDLVKLNYLAICDSNITDNGIKNLTGLLGLHLGYNKYVTDNGIKNLINLTNLDLLENENISDQGIKNLTNLQRLNLYRNRMITNAGISELTNLTVLNLTLNYNITDEGIYNLTKLKSLTIGERITGNNFTRFTNLAISVPLVFK